MSKLPDIEMKFSVGSPASSALTEIESALELPEDSDNRQLLQLVYQQLNKRSKLSASQQDLYQRVCEALGMEHK